MQQAEIVPGMLFRGRKVYLEQWGKNKEEVDADKPKVKRDCFDFAIGIRAAQERARTAAGLIIDPRRFRVQNEN